MKIKLVSSLLIISAVAVAVGYQFNQQQPQVVTAAETQLQPQTAQSNPSNPQQLQAVVEPVVPQVMKKPVSTQVHEVANYDTRKVKVASQSVVPTMTREQAEQVLTEKQQQMEQLVALYDQSLTDPKRKADIERKFKLHMEQYKQALVAKLQRGEI